MSATAPLSAPPQSHTPQYIYERHADLLDGVYFEVTTPGTLVITYPEAVTVADGEAVISMLAPELDAFIASYLN